MKPVDTCFSKPLYFVFCINFHSLAAQYKDCDMKGQATVIVVLGPLNKTTRHEFIILMLVTKIGWLIDDRIF